MRKKILFVSNRLIGGGSERVLVTIANALCEKDYEVNILSYHSGETYALNSKINVINLNKGKNKITRIIEMRKIFKKNKPDVIISFEYFVNMQTIIACFGLNVNVIVSERNDPSRKGGEFPNNIIRNILYYFCDRLVCQTIDAKNYFPKSIQKKAVIILNPIKPDLPKVWMGERKHVVVNFCRLEKQKNLKLLIDSFIEFRKEFLDYTLEIYGDGNEKEALIEYIQKLMCDDYVKILPSTKNIHEKIIKAKMFVSTSDYEGLSNSMLEAMAIGLPSICTDCPCGGARMVIENNKNGILVPVGQQSAVVNAMRSIASNNEMEKLLSVKGSEIKEKLEQERIISQWIELLI